MFNANPNIGILDPLEAKTVIMHTNIETIAEVNRQPALREQHQEIN